jgi:hypothetical protein
MYDPFLEEDFFSVEFSAKFVAKIFTPAEVARLEEQLWLKRQGPNESVDIYCNEFSLLAKECGIKDDDTTAIKRFLKSLNPVMQHTMLQINNVTPFTSFNALYAACRANDTGYIFGDQAPLPVMPSNKRYLENNTPAANPPGRRTRSHCLRAHQKSSYLPGRKFNSATLA